MKRRGALLVVTALLLGAVAIPKTAFFLIENNPFVVAAGPGVAPVNVLLVSDRQNSDYKIALGLDPSINLTVTGQGDLSAGSLAGASVLFLEDCDNLTSSQVELVKDRHAAGMGIFFQTPSPGQELDVGAFTSLQEVLPVTIALEDGHVTEETPGFGNINTRVVENSPNFVAERVGFISLPQLLNLTETSLSAGATCDEVVRSESGRPLLVERVFEGGQGRVFALTAPVRPDSNEHLADWPSFTYWMFVTANYLAGNEDVPTFGDWDYSPVPHEDSRVVVLALLLVICGITVALFVYFRARTKKSPLALVPVKVPARPTGGPNTEGERDIGPGGDLGSDVGLDSVDGGDADDPRVKTWETIGYHKPLAGALVMLFLTLVVIMPLLVLVLYVLPTFILTDPSQIGIQFITGSIFSAIFIAADFGLAQAFDKFVGENYAKDPRKALKYIQFFFWFQITSGLAQTTVISLLGLYFVPHWNSMNFMSWFFVFKAFVQWPGVGYIFTHTLKSIQRTDKEQMVMLVNLLFVQLLGTVLFTETLRQWGASDPRIGSVVGGSLGLTVADTVSQFSLVLIGAWFLTRVDKRFRLADVFRLDFDRALVKQTLWFGLKSMLANVIYLFGNFFTTILIITRLNNYAYWGMFVGAGAYLFFPIIYLTSIYENALPTTAEAYGAGKEKLTSAYITYGFKYFGTFGVLIFVLFTFFLSQFLTAVVPPLFKPMGWFIALYSITRLFICLGDFSRLFLVAIDRVSQYVVLVLVEQIVRLTLLLLFIDTLQYWVLIFGELPGVIVKVVVTWSWTHKKVVPVRINAWQTFFAPGVAALVLLGVGALLFKYVYLPGNQLLGVLPNTLVFTFVFFAGFTLFVWPAVLGLAGGWDEETLAQLEFASRNCGPSKPLASVFYRVTRWASAKSPLFGRHPIPYEAAGGEALELLELKRAGDERV
ncbi:MAG: hypothetical protein ACTSU5_12465 [Promethearchaeota archaeon]